MRSTNNTILNDRIGTEDCVKNKTLNFSRAYFFISIGNTFKYSKLSLSKEKPILVKLFPKEFVIANISANNKNESKNRKVKNSVRLTPSLVTPKIIGNNIKNGKILGAMIP